MSPNDFFREKVHEKIIKNCSLCHASNQTPLFAKNDWLNSISEIETNGLIDLQLPEESVFMKKIKDGHHGITDPIILVQMEVSFYNWSYLLKKN